MGYWLHFVVDLVQKACPSGWFSIFWINSRALVLCACFTTECGNPGIRLSMFTSPSIVCSWLESSWLTTGLPVQKNSIRVWLGWLVDFCLSSNFRTQFLNPIMSQGNLRKRSRWFNYFFVFDSSNFHPNGFRDTNKLAVYRNEWQRSLAENYNPFLMSKFDIDPIHRVLMFLPCCMHVPCKTRCTPSRSSQDPCVPCP